MIPVNIDKSLFSYSDSFKKLAKYGDFFLASTKFKLPFEFVPFKILFKYFFSIMNLSKPHYAIEYN